jgi:hypothetical protein
VAVAREEVKSALHVRAFAEFVAAHIQGMRDQLAGNLSPPGQSGSP